METPAETPEPETVPADDPGEEGEAGEAGNGDENTEAGEAE